MHARRCPKSRRWRRGVAPAAALLFLFLACAPPTAIPDDAPLTPPFAVSDHFSPTGYMGDGATIGVVNMVAAACPTRAPSAVGDCYKVTYTPPIASTYAGVYWQYPGNNWGDYVGHNVRPGATRATVWAMGDAGGEQVAFKVGGIGLAPDGSVDPSKPYHDSLLVSASPVTLTKQWQQFTVDFSGATYVGTATTYGEVLGGFAWIVNPPLASQVPIVFYLDAIRWSP